MLEVCFDFTLSVTNSLILVSSMFADSDSLAFLLCVQSNTTTSTNTTIIIGNTKDMAREEADRYTGSLESTITTGASFFLSVTTPVVRSFEVVCSISLPSDSVVVVGPFIVLVEVIEIKPSGVVGALSVVVVVGRVCASTSLGVVAFSSSTVGGGAVFAAIEVASGFISV